MNSSSFYITTAIAYTNAGPHLGHALEFIQADAIARYKRLMGYDTWFLTGTDEHGIKNYNTAKKAGLPVLQFVHQNAEKFKGLKEALDLSYDDFIQTSDTSRHYPAAQKLWLRLQEKGDIYMKEYEGLYCEGCEMFLKEVDLENGFCKIHKKEPIFSKESNYFFRLSNYSEEIVKLIESGTIKLLPTLRQNEFLNMAKEGLHDVSFSRPKASLPWGVPVPTDPDHVMYVWCDALTNYISSLGYAGGSERFRRYWPADVHLIGKDIVRFHAGIWIGMLLSAELELPQSILVHGFVTHNGEKMSKSLGNVVDPIAVAKSYGRDSLRYYLLREIPMGNDGDFNDTLFVERYNSDLANNLGNLLNRVHTLVERNVQVEFQFESEDGSFCQKTDEAWSNYHEMMKDYRLSEAIFSVWRLIDFANKKMEETKPWSLVKANPTAGWAVLSHLLEVLRHVSLMIYPFMPSTSQKIRSQLGLKALDLTEIQSFEWGGEPEWSSLGERSIVFPRIEL